jgi:hypothetical protein
VEIVMAALVIVVPAWVWLVWWLWQLEKKDRERCGRKS